jgi:membrane associated rhomboid family serine protease
VGIWGLIGFAFIDNAAHLGGLCGGLLLGVLWLKPSAVTGEEQRLPRKRTALAVLGLLLLVAVAITAVWKMAQ